MIRDFFAASAAEYLQQLADLLFGLLLDVIHTHQPEIEPVLRGQPAEVDRSPELVARTIQAQGIWFQLLSIAEQIAAMRERRRTEVDRGYEEVRGTFAHVTSAAAGAGVPAAEVRAVLANLRIKPVITAHPTEAKRVTVLERHRRIYLGLFELEATRWTPRERQALIDEIRNDIEILWLTGELRLEKPTVAQELAWGHYFVNEILFDVVPQMLARVERGLTRAYPGERFDVPPFFQFGSWIGGDRDGNPFVTNDVTRQTLNDNRLASLQRYRRRLGDLIRTLSLTERTLTISPAFRQALVQQLELSGEGERIVSRNPGEVFRQYLACVLRRLDATIEFAARGRPAPARFGYPAVEELIADLRVLEQTLIDAGCERIATSAVAPVRREVEVFRFSTFRLDMRENTIRINEALGSLWRLRNGALPLPGSADWRAWLQVELARPLKPGHAPAELPEGPRETLGMFRLIHDVRDHVDREAIGTFILSMTHSVDDVLGTYVLAKEAGLFADAAGTESCTLPIVPLFESIEDLQRAPDIMRELLQVPLVRRSVRAQGGVHEVMIGYSDSNKDGGLPDVQLGARKNSGEADAAGSGVRRADRVLSRPGRVGQPRRRAHRSGDRGAAGRIHSRPPPADRAGGGRLRQVRQPRHGGLPDRAVGRECVRALDPVGAGGSAPSTRPSSTKRSRPWRAPPTRRTGAWRSTRISWCTSRPPARSRRSRSSTSDRARRGGSAPRPWPISAPSPGCSRGPRTGTACPVGTAWGAASRPSSRCGVREARRS